MESISTSTSIVILVVLLCATAFASASEMAIASVNRIRIKSKAESGDKKAKKILNLLERRDNTITTIVVLNNIVNIAIPTISTLIFTKNFPVYGALISSVLMTVLILIFGEIIPKSLGNRYAEKYLNTMIGFISFVIALFKPIAFVFIIINNGLIKLLERGNNEQEELVELEDEILTMIEESSLEGKIEENEEELIRNAIEFNDTIVESILQPRRNVFMLDINLSNDDLFKEMCEMRFSRVPFYDEDKDNILGIISEREFLTEYILDKDFDPRTILRAAKYIPDTVKISKLLPELQITKSQMAIVVDERGTVQGIVTVEDILEELVGEIYDEHDDFVNKYTMVNEECYEVTGEITISEFNQLFATQDIESENSETTIAGYVIELAEKIPDIGEIYEDEHFIFEIMEIEGNKIEIVKATLKEKTEENE